VLQSEAFTQGTLHAALIDGWLAEQPALLERPAPSDELWAVAACVLAEGTSGGWFRPRGVAGVELSLQCEAQTRRARFEQDAETARVSLAEGPTLALRLLERDAHGVRYEVEGLIRRAACLRTRDALHVSQDGELFVFREPSRASEPADASDPRRVLAPLSGTLRRLAVAPGDVVQQGDVLLVVEAMKMETRVCAAVRARVLAVPRAPGDQVAASELLVELEPLPVEARASAREHDEEG
jgi:acetyl/propionyl-CoA carboxylase alpha subunit